MTRVEIRQALEEGKTYEDILKEENDKLREQLEEEKTRFVKEGERKRKLRAAEENAVSALEEYISIREGIEKDEKLHERVVGMVKGIKFRVGDLFEMLFW